MYLENATYIHPETLEITRGPIRVDSGEAGKMRFVNEVPEGEVTINCEGQIVMQAFGNAHHHVYSALARGMPPAPEPPRDFKEILSKVWWAVDKALDREMIEASALVTAIECAKKGVTFVIDHHSSPFAVKDSLRVIAKAFERVGVGHLLCVELSDRDNEDARERGIEETVRYLEKYRQGLVGLHASFAVGDDLLERAVGIAQKFDTGIHIHVAEDVYDQQHSAETYGKRVVERLSDAGVLDLPATLLAHGLHLNERERELIRESSAWVVHNAESNQNNNVGTFNGAGLGERIMIGTDGMHSDMIRSAHASYLIRQSTDAPSPVDIHYSLRNIRNYVKMNGWSGLGENDLVILDYDPPTEMNSENLAGHFVYGIDSSQIHSVISRGKLIVRNRILLTVDETEINEFARKKSAELWQNLERYR